MAQVADLTDQLMTSDTTIFLPTGHNFTQEGEWTPGLQTQKTIFFFSIRA